MVNSNLECESVTPARCSLWLRWFNYFQQNRNKLLPIPWDAAYRLSQSEKATISASIQNFQLGESSEGTHLMRLARAHADRSQNTSLVETVKLFIGEEQRHARDLGRFMQEEGIPLVQHHWSDRLFRKLRRQTNLEMALTVLLTAELVATIYYDALGKATQSPILEQICRQITWDEQQHVWFQSEALASLDRDRPQWQSACYIRCHHWFFSATLLLVWLDHHPVFRTSGYSFKRYYQAAQCAFRGVVAIRIKAVH